MLSGGALSWVRSGSLVACAVAVAAWDVRFRRVPNALSAAGLGVGLAASLGGGWTSLMGSLAGATVFGGSLTLAWASGLVGAGDAKAAMAFGALLGMPAALDGLLWGTVAGALLAVAMSGALWFRSVADLRAAWRHGGWSGLAATVATHPAWGVAVPYAAALAAGSLGAFVLIGWRI